MCWSAGASIAATAIGGVATVYAAKKNVPKIRTFTLGFFTLMELLQAVSYLWIDQCATTGNVWVTYLSFLHISFQIPVISAFTLSYASEKMRKKWFKPIMIISSAATVLMLAKLLVPLIPNIPPQWLCVLTEPLCGTKACTYKGDWHLAWELPLWGLYPSLYLYYIPVFILPILYGCWRVALYMFVVGPMIAFSITTNYDEAPAIWCLFSIAIVGAMILTPLRRWLETPMRKKS
jgi:uncharacterized protein DUF5765